MKHLNPTRREFLHSMGAVATWALVPSLGISACGNGNANAKTGMDAHGLSQGPFDVELNMRAQPAKASILPGAPSDVWRYTAELLQGPEGTLAPMGESYLGPLIRLRRGQRVRVHIENGLPEDTTVHWHGLHVPSDVDGQPRLPIRPGQSMTVAFEVNDRAGFYWYHPHPHGPQGGRVGYQSYAGLAGPLIIEDEVEQELDLPSGDNQKVLVLQDRRFDGDNQTRYLDDGMGSMMARMMGFLGDRVLVNGQPDAHQRLAAGPHRLRVLNGSNARIYKLAWSDGRPMTVIGTGGGLLSAPVERPYLTLAPAQRTDIWVDLTGATPGSTLQLISEAFQTGGMMGGGMMGGGMMDGGMMGRGMMDGGMMDGGMMDRGMMGNSLPMGARIPLLTLEVDHTTGGRLPLPGQLANDLPPPGVDSGTNIRRFTLGMRMMRGFTINGRRFEGVNVADDEIVQLGQTEIWEFVNDTMMPHPMHIHGLQFAVVDRRQVGSNQGWHGLSDGLVDSGLHDTVMVMPGERLRIALTFKDFTGAYIYHCHNMEHEDNGMMRYFEVRA